MRLRIGLCGLLLMLLLPAPGMAERQPFLEMEAAPDRPYVQARVLLTLRLYRASHLQQGDFLLPEIPGALVEFLAEEEPRPVQRAGEHLELIEQRYLLFPQHRGPLQLPAPLFSGRDLFVQGRPLTLQVRPPPPQARRPWLPATGVRLSARWGETADPWRRDEPRLRVITLEAGGLTGAQLPALPLPALDGLEVQRVRVEVRDRIEGDDLTGSRVEYWRLIPLKSGRLRLPEITVHWWNTDTERPMATRLKSRELTIGEAPAAPPPDPGSGESAGAPAPAAGGEPANRVIPPTTGLTLLTLLLLAGVTTVVLRDPRYRCWRRCRRNRADFHRACRRGDPHQARRALLAWAAGRPDGRRCGDTLPALAAALDDPPARQAILGLDRALYGREGAPWDGSQAAAAVLPHLHCRMHRPGAKSGSGPIPQLNP